jgi:microcystin-dependent protein
MAISSALGMANAVPVGVVNPFAGATAPSGWLLCFGQAVSRTAYPVLFTTLSTTYGAGDGSTTFNLPDLRGRAIAGKDDMGGTAASRLTATVLSAANTLGATGGAQTHTLTSAQSGVPAHGHSASSNTTGAHGHTYVQPYNTSGTSAAGGYAYIFYDRAATTESAGAHSHTITVSNNSAADASSAHTNTQPTIILNYIIKAL